MTLHKKLCFCFLVLLAVGACSSSDNSAAPIVGGTTEAGSTEAGSTEDGSTEAGSTEAGSTEAGSTEAGSTEAGSTEAGSTEAGSTDSGGFELLSSCQTVPQSILTENGGIISSVLPADLSASGARIVVLAEPDGELTGFDSKSGQIDYSPTASRLSQLMRYRVVDGSNTVLAEHQHRWVFEPVRVVPLGDSITSGVEYFDGSDLPPMNLRTGYRQFLYERLFNNNYRIDYLGQGGQSAGADAGLVDPENNGYPGVDIEFLNGKLIEQLTEDATDIILLHIGTNNTPTDASGIDDWLDTLDAWEAENNPVLALVATIVPKRDVAQNAVVDAFNSDLRQRIQQRTDDLVYLVEQNTAVLVSDISDEPIGLHPNKTGYEKMANVWYDALVSKELLHKCD